MSACPEEYLALIDKHGGFFWNYGRGEEGLVFATTEQRDAFDAEWRARGGAFEQPKADDARDAEEWMHRSGEYDYTQLPGF